MKPVLSLVTGARNRPESFRRLVDSIVEHTSTPWELVVSDASDEPIVCDLPNVRILPERPRLGCTKGFNRAFREAMGEWVIWLNDDAEVCPGYDREAMRFMKSHPEIGLGALHYSECGGPFHVNSAWKTIYANFGIVPRHIGESVGWFDEDLQMYGCDNSLALKILLQNYGIADIPDSRILHHSVKDQARIENQHMRSRDNEILTSKYMPRQREWVWTFNRLRVHSGAEPWSHGVQPGMAYAR